MKSNNTSWGAVSKWYDELVESGNDSYQKEVILPNILRIVNPKPEMTILDVACGQGFFARAFAENGAIVIGSDVSKELIDLALTHLKTSDEKIRNNVRFVVSPSDKLQSFGTVDVITIILALQNIEKMRETLGECARILKPGGKIVVVLNHPAFRIPKNSSWQWESLKDEKGIVEKQYRRIDAYMSDKQFKIDMNPGEKDANKKHNTISFHRPLQSYFKALNGVGFAITRFEEWISHKTSLAGPRSDEENRMRKEIPLFLCIEAKLI